MLLVPYAELDTAGHIGPDNNHRIDKHRMRTKPHPDLARLRLRVTSHRQLAYLPLLLRKSLKRELRSDPLKNPLIHQSIEMSGVADRRTHKMTGLRSPAETNQA